MIAQSRKKRENTTSPALHRRLFFIVGVIGVIVFVIIVRLLVLQVFGHEDYADLALRQHSSEQVLSAQRGTIYYSSRDGLFPAAVNRQYYLAFVSPRDVPENELDDVAQRIDSAFENVSADEMRPKLQRRKDIYEVITHKVTKEEKERIQGLEIPGVAFLPEKVRFYPGEELAANLLGFVGSDGEQYSGRYGLEAFHESELSGTDGFRKQKKDARGGWLSVSDRFTTKEHDGVDLVLTIDHEIQENVEKILKEDMEKYGARSASAIVMEPATGKIRAMTNFPTFSPNEYGKVDDISVYKNANVSDTYESGSVFKTFTIAIGLDAGKITPESTYVDTGSVSIGGYNIGNAEGKVYGLQTMTKVLEESINTGVIHVEQLVGNTAFKEYVERFGFGTYTDIGLPVEAPGNTVNIQNTRRNIEFYTASFGQGITVTPMQLVRAYGALANGGFLMKPQLVEKKIHADGREEVIESEQVHRVISEEASDKITLMLEKVVTGGHARLASVEGYRVVGKTGTAQIVDPETGTYFDESRKNATFIGYAPADEPKFVVLVKYDTPTNAEWAATSASPTFGRIMKYLLEYDNIRPTEPIKPKQAVIEEVIQNVVD